MDLASRFLQSSDYDDIYGIESPDLMDEWNNVDTSEDPKHRSYFYGLTSTENLMLSASSSSYKSASSIVLRDRLLTDYIDRGRRGGNLGGADSSIASDDFITEFSDEYSCTLSSIGSGSDGDDSNPATPTAHCHDEDGYYLKAINDPSEALKIDSKCRYNSPPHDDIITIKDEPTTLFDELAQSSSSNTLSTLQLSYLPNSNNNNEHMNDLKQQFKNDTLPTSSFQFNRNFGNIQQTSTVQLLKTKHPQSLLKDITTGCGINVSPPNNRLFRKTSSSVSSSSSSCSNSSVSAPTFLRKPTPPSVEASFPRQLRTPIKTSLISNQPKNGFGDLFLTEEEKKTLISEGFPVPSKLPLTKVEEKSLKKIRRKIKNKISAQESRRKKKEFVDTLERRVQVTIHELNAVKRRYTYLERENHDLKTKICKLEAALVKQSNNEVGQKNPAQEQNKNLSCIRIKQEVSLPCNNSNGFELD